MKGVPDEQGFSVLILWNIFIYKRMYLVVAQGDGCTVRYVVIAFKFLLTSNVLAFSHKYHLVVMGWFLLPVLRFHQSQQSATEHWFFCHQQHWGLSGNAEIEICFVPNSSAEIYLWLHNNSYFIKMFSS